MQVPANYVQVSKNRAQVPRLHLSLQILPHVSRICILHQRRDTIHIVAKLLEICYVRTYVMSDQDDVTFLLVFFVDAGVVRLIERMSEAGGDYLRSIPETDELARPIVYQLSWTPKQIRDALALPKLESIRTTGNKV